eukprot:750771-Hanusia_phi.AAC.4
MSPSLRMLSDPRRHKNKHNLRLLPSIRSRRLLLAGTRLDDMARSVAELSARVFVLHGASSWMRDEADPKAAGAPAEDTRSTPRREPDPLPSSRSSRQVLRLNLVRTSRHTRSAWGEFDEQHANNQQCISLLLPCPAHPASSLCNPRCSILFLPLLDLPWHGKIPSLPLPSSPHTRPPPPFPLHSAFSRPFSHTRPASPLSHQQFISKSGAVITRSVYFQGQ